MITLETVATTFAELSSRENETMFAQGDLLTQAVDAGFSLKEVLTVCGTESGKSARTMRERYRVGKVFSGQSIAQDLDWSLYQACAAAPGVDLEKPDTYGIAHQWIDTALAGFTENGIQRKHSTRTLKRLFDTAPKAKDQVETVLDRMQCTIHQMDVNTFYRDETHVILAIPLRDCRDLFFIGETVTVTITRVVQTPAQEAAA